MQNHHNPDDESSQPEGRTVESDDTGPALDRSAEDGPEPAADLNRDPLPDFGPPVTPYAFALCVDGYDPDDYPSAGESIDPELVFAWGLTVGADTLVYRATASGGPREYGVFSSAERARDLFSHVLPLRLVWL